MSRLSATFIGLTSTVLSLFRIVFGLSFFLHGTSKLFSFPIAQSVETRSSAWWAGVLELVLGALITVGLFTRIAAFVASGVMAVAYFTQHFPDGFWPIQNKGELAVLYCWGFFLLVFTGSGWLALDAVLRRVRRGKRTDGVDTSVTAPPAA